MIGHMPLIALRMAHKRPKAVWLWVGIPPNNWAANWHEFEDLLAHPEVVIEPSDNPKILDLRFLVGLQVHIDGNDTDDRMFGVHLACMAAGASDVFTFHNGELIWDKGEKVEVLTT